MSAEEKIWNYLLGKLKNPYGVAAIMGNLMAESSLDPHSVTGSKNRKTYVSDADSGKIDFVHDGCAFGLVQWCYWSRKRDLLAYAKSKLSSVGDLNTQLAYMVQEIQKYKPVYNSVINSKDIREISDLVLHKYERPANQSEAVEKKRANYAQKFFDKYNKTDNVKPKASRNIWESVMKALKEEL